MCLLQLADIPKSIFAPARSTGLETNSNSARFSRVKKPHCLHNQLHAEKDLQTFNSLLCATLLEERVMAERWEQGKGGPSSPCRNCPMLAQLGRFFWGRTRHFAPAVAMANAWHQLTLFISLLISTYHSREWVFLSYTMEIGINLHFPWGAAIPSTHPFSSSCASLG